MKKIIKRIQPFLFIGVSGLVLLICMAGIAGIWLVEGAGSSLARMDVELYTIQVQSRHLQKLLPIALLSSAVAVTLMAIWSGYSQFVMIKRNLEE